VHSTDRPVDHQESAEQVEDQPDGLPVSIDAADASGYRIVSSRDEGLLVFPRSQDQLLLPREHPVPTDPWV
jgi:hypothetical protein